MMRFALSFLATLLLSTSALADQITLSRQVLLPDGKPAAGAKVYVRTFSIYGFPAKKLQSIETFTDRDGLYRVTLNSPSVMPGYVLVDAKGAALALCPTVSPILAAGEGNRSKPIKLEPEFFVAGRAVNQKGMPVPGVTVALAALYSDTYTPVPLSSGNFEDVPPELKARTDRNGRYRFRGIGGLDSVIPGTAKVEAYAKGDWQGTHYLGDGQIGFDANSKADAGEPNLITLNPTGDISGQVIDGVTGKPISKLDLYISTTHEWAPLPSSKTETDDEGRFKMKGMLAETVINIRKDGYPFTQVYFPYQHVQGATLPPKSRVVTIVINPIVHISGKLVDDQTGVAPLVDPEILVPQNRHLEGGATEVSSGFGRIVPSATKDEKPFDIDAPAGRVRLAIIDPQYNAYYAYGEWRDFDMPANGAQNVTITLHRQPGILFKLDIDDPNRVNIMSPKNDIEIDITRSGDPGEIYEGYLATGWFFHVDKWGETVTVRILERHKDGSKTDLIPPQSFVADPKIWPVTIKVPPNT